jgi:hypothetical protein
MNQENSKAGKIEVETVFSWIPGFQIKKLSSSSPAFLIQKVI